MHDDLQPSPRAPGGALRALGFHDRRAGAERRSGEHSVPDDITARRRLRDRRESPSGHIRNVLQVLTAVDYLRLDEGEPIPVESIRRALWLALLELERGQERVG